MAVLGGRESPRREEIGRLKWGVGKLIARASVRPVVVPFYHHNMEKVMPQNEKNQLISVVPKTNVDIRVRVGEPISFDDLFDAYEKSRVVGATPWQTQEREKALFQAITKRIEDALLELAEPSKQQQHQ
jgi:monolysocardiolipin acyltransferase